MSSQVSMGTAWNISKSEALNATGQGYFDLNGQNPPQAPTHQIGTSVFDQPDNTSEIDDANALEDYYSTAKKIEQPMITKEKEILVHTKSFEEYESGRASLIRSNESPRKSILTNRSRGSLRRSSLEHRDKEVSIRRSSLEHRDKEVSIRRSSFEHRDKDVTLSVSPSKVEINYSVGSTRKGSVGGQSGRKSSRKTVEITVNPTEG
jgi:hypothetical protein